MSDTDQTQDQSGRLEVGLLNLLAAAQIAFFLTTAIWFPPFHFPQVPLLESARHWPDWVNLAAGIGSLAGTFFARSAREKPSRRIRHAVCAVSFTVLFVMNQHRLQVWAWQLFLLHGH